MRASEAAGLPAGESRGHADGGAGLLQAARRGGGGVLPWSRQGHQTDHDQAQGRETKVSQGKTDDDGNPVNFYQLEKLSFLLGGFKSIPLF